MPEIPVWALGVAWLLAAIARGMPQPPENAPYWLRWLFNVCQGLGANFDLFVRRTKEKGTPEKP